MSIEFSTTIRCQWEQGEPDGIAYTREKIGSLPSNFTTIWIQDHLQKGTQVLLESWTTVAGKYILIDQSGRQSCYPHKRSMVSGGSAECRVTDLTHPLTNIFPDSIRRPRGDVGGNRSASPEPLYDSEFRVFSVMVG